MSKATENVDPLIDLDEARELLGGIGRTKFYDLIQLGELPKPAKLGSRSFWRRSRILAYIDRVTNTDTKET